MFIKIRPKFRFYEAEYYLKTIALNAVMVRNTGVYDAVKRLTLLARPSSVDKYEKQWQNFYLPLKRSGKEISIPFGVMKYERDFYCWSPLGRLEVRSGNQPAEKFFEGIFNEMIRFFCLMDKTGNDIVRRTVPYDIRTGRIMGRYLMDKTLSPKRKGEILDNYNAYLGKRFEQEGCSLKEYLETATICYKAAFGDKTAGLSPLDLYEKYADTRHGGMLSINDPQSKEEYLKWYESNKWTGAHPFEIVFSMIDHGIHLYPPSSHNSWKYQIEMTNYAYAGVFIKMVEALIEKRISFAAMRIEEVLDYLAGDSYFTVNDYSDNFFFYHPCREHKNKYFKYIEWDDLPVLKSKWARVK